MRWVEEEENLKGTNHHCAAQVLDKEERVIGIDTGCNEDKNKDSGSFWG